MLITFYVLQFFQQVIVHAAPVLKARTLRAVIVRGAPV